MTSLEFSNSIAKDWQDFANREYYHRYVNWRPLTEELHRKLLDRFVWSRDEVIQEIVALWADGYHESLYRKQIRLKRVKQKLEKQGNQDNPVKTKHLELV